MAAPPPIAGQASAPWGAELCLLFWWVALCALPACPRIRYLEGVAALARVDAARTRRSFSRLENALELPNLIDIQRRSFEWLVDTEKGGLRETIDDVSPIEDYTGNLAVVFEDIHFDEPVASDLGVSREGPHLRAPADRQGRLPEPRDRRDPRAVRLHGRLPVDDRLGHVHHQRHRARGRHAARPLPGRLRDGAEGPREAGLHREPDAGPRLLARARDRQEGQGLRPHRPQAQAAGHGAAARDGRRAARGRLRARELDRHRRGDPRAVRQLASTSASRSRPTPRSRSPRRAR